MSPTDASSYSVEVVQRSREIAQLRDQKCKTEQLLAESHLRNQRLVDKTKELDGVIARKSQEVRQLSHQIVELEHRLGEAVLQQQHALQRTSELEAEVARKAHDASGLHHRISELEGQLAFQVSESRELQKAQSEQRDEWARGLLDLQGPGQPLPRCRTPGGIQPKHPAEPLRPPVLAEEDEVFMSMQTLPVCVGGSQPATDPLEAFYIGDEDSSHILQQMQDRALESLQGAGAGSRGATPRGCRGPAGSVPPPPTPRGVKDVRAGPPPVPGTEFADLIAYYKERSGAPGS